VQTAPGHSSLWTADLTIMKFKISKQLIVAGAQVITACTMVLVYVVIVMNSWLGNCRLLDWTAIWSKI